MAKGTAIIVGAGSGTGSAVAKALASEGHPVVVARRSEGALAKLVGEIEATGGRALGVSTNAADENQVKALFKTATEQFGPIEFVSFNAAGFLISPAVDTTAELFTEMWQASALGGFLVGREAARHMLEPGRGSIVFTGATASVKASAKFAAFASGKHGLRAVATSLAKELGPQGVHVAHVLVDGVIDVPRVHEHMPDFAASKGEDGLIDPDAIAQTLLWLHRQPRNAWTFELDLRPYKEPW